MKVLFTFALLALVCSIVSGDGHDSPTECPEGQGLAVKWTGNGSMEKKCVPCKPEDPTRSMGCDTRGQGLTLCQKYKMKKYCEDDNKWAYFVQPMCMFTCEKC